MPGFDTDSAHAAFNQSAIQVRSEQARFESGYRERFGEGLQESDNCVRLTGDLPSATTLPRSSITQTAVNFSETSNPA
jgi:hypothetical protein